MDRPLLSVGICLSLAFLLVRSIYRLFPHSLSKFPGPKIAAVTHAYEFYFDTIKGGGGNMYGKSSDCTRNRSESVPTSSTSKTPISTTRSIYTSLGKRQEKGPSEVRALTSPGSVAATVDHHHHRLRRETLNPFFSKRAVLALEHLLHDKVAKVRDVLKRAHRDQTVVSLDGIFTALTADIILHYTSGESMAILDSTDFKNEFHEAVIGATDMSHITRFAPDLSVIFEALPGLIQWMKPNTRGLFDAKRMIEEKATLALRGEFEQGERAKTIFHALTDPSLPAEERTPRRLLDEALVVLGAGTETTGRVLTVGSFHVYRNPAILAKLRDELRRVMPKPRTQVPLSELEKLPYLTAVINESLRLAHSVTLRLMRIAPSSVLQYGDWEIPAGTAVSQSIYFVHTDPTVFPDPRRFYPERWIEAADRGERLTKFLVPFSKGPRNCLGLNLAYSEMYRMFGALVRGFDLEIYQTTEESIRITRDMLFGQPDSGALKVDSLVANVITH